MNPFELTGGTVSSSNDLERILALPRRAMDEAALEALADELTSVLKTAAGTKRLRKLQALALYELAIHGGGFFPLGVGEGKTILTLLAPYVLDAKKPMLFLPAGLIDKTKKEAFTNEDCYARHWLVSTHIYTFSYEMFGRADYAGELEKYAPDLILLDEAHKLKNPDAAVTKRFLRYMEAHPETLVVAMSGTIMDHSILEFAHILRWCLKGRSPVPLSDSELSEWAAALDVKAPRGNEFARFDVGALTRLADGVPELASVECETSRARQGFRQRLVSTPGVVASFEGGEKVHASIRLKGIVYAPTALSSDPTEEHFNRLRADMKMTNDWDLTTHMEVWAHAREIALGLSYIWKVKPPDEWLNPRKAWFKFIRKALKESSANSGELDSPYQVEQAVTADTWWASFRVLVRRNDKEQFVDGKTLLNDWFDIKDSFTPETMPEWHDDFALDACAKWARTSGPGIIWTEHTLFAERLAKKTGLKYYGQRGLTVAGELIDDADPRKSVIASADANKEGRNLQSKWSKNLITSLEPRPGKNQQMIGRTHRAGQEADEVFVDILIGCLEHLKAWADVIPAAQAVRDTTGEQQKLLLAGSPEYWPSEFEIAKWTGARWRQPAAKEDFDPVKEFEKERLAA